MYYLQSRYYDPAVGRFINADEAVFVCVPGQPCNKNILVYCSNDSVNRWDTMGYLGNAISLKIPQYANFSAAWPGIMACITASISSIKAAICTSWCIPLCIAATIIAVIGISYAVSKAKTMLESATKVIAAAKACVKSGGIDPNKLRLYTVYVIARVGTVDVVYVGMTSNYTARKKAHTGKRFPKSLFTMMPVATGLNRNKARALEQILITAYGLDTLINMINSIAPKKWEFFLSEFGQMLTLIDSWLDPE